ncbi:ATP-grasp domain-containing protein [[Muricauda] lutisoli]|uniref:ATP-grasp domain-containing protein n=1 Tax=[Muricauda] lutisoli TaxID=2816035 RepID=A0ABS3EVW9_9FLAO|nr:hypothetical protein [[Muricauda] lutisoli]MBO0330086.1 hypothetical protein [[Muricauda] lutisoli]
MILIVTHKRDYTADFVINKLNKKGICYKRLNCEDLDRSSYSFEINSDFEFSFKDETNFSSGWFRRTKLPVIENISEAEKLYLLSEYDSLTKNILSSIDCNWLSKPKNIYNAENKTLQLKKAKELGFLIPPTLITNDKSSIKKFYLMHGQNIIVKPIGYSLINYSDSPGYIFTNEVNSQIIKTIDQYYINPCIFQKNIQKDYEIRVTVVGSELFAAKCDSQKNDETKTDWRRGKLLFKEVEIPSQISNLCVSLVKKLELGFGAIDLIKTENDEYYFLEINPNGQWAWIEMQTKQPISEALIKQLCK